MTVATVRLLAADPESYDRATAEGDGATAEFRVPNTPVVADSQKIFVANVEKTEGVHYAFDDELGLCTFTVGNIPAGPPGPDLPGEAIVITYRHTLLSDARLADLLVLEGDNDKLAAAQALDVIASSEALVAKKIKLLDIQTDGPAVAASLRAHAKELRDQVAAAAIAGDAAFDTAEMVVDDFSARERWNAEVLRG